MWLLRPFYVCSVTGSWTLTKASPLSTFLIFISSCIVTFRISKPVNYCSGSTAGSECMSVIDRSAGSCKHLCRGWCFTVVLGRSGRS